MSSKNLSLIVWCWYDLPTDAIQVQMTRVDTGENVRVKGGSFLLRISTDEVTSVMRCSIRHIASGREAHVQGGPNLRAFVKDCLLKSDEAQSTAPDTPKE